MTSELTFKTNSKFQSVTFDKDSGGWYIIFSDEIIFNIYAFWRILNNKQIKLVSLDHGHIFGLSDPIDLSKILTETLTGKILLEIKIKKDTADLLLTFTDNFELEIFISSAGYETYNFFIGKKKYIGMGSGEIAVFNDL